MPLFRRRAPQATRLVEHYGPGARQLGEWWVPLAPPPGRLATVVLVHGGYWRPRYDRHLQDAVAAELAGAGFLVWNLEYAASDNPWPATLTDVSAGYDHVLAGEFAERVDGERIAVVGHSAGGQLALFLGSRGRLPADAAGAGPHVAPALVVAQAPVAALARAADERLGDGAVLTLLGGSPAKVPDRYARADPVALVGTGRRSLLLHSAADTAVPISQSSAYEQAARTAGDPGQLTEVPGDHFAHLDPASPAWAVARQALDDLGGFQ